MEETIEIVQDDITLDYNAIKTISVNGVERPIDANKNVNIPVPTKVSDLTNDSGFLVEETDPTVPTFVKNITQEDITNWNNKSDFSGDYNDLTNKPTIPSALSDLTDDTTHRTVTDTEKTTWNNKSNFSGSYNDLTDKPSIPSALSDLTDDSTHRVVTDTEKTTWNNKSDFSGDYNDLTNKPTIPDVSDFITKDVNDLTYYELATATGNNIELSINSSTYVMTLNLKNSAGTTISTDTVDLPLESMVVSGSYDDTTKKIILTLQSGSTVEFSVADLVSGLQSEITSNNKLASDLVDDTNQTNKFVTAAEKTKLSGIETGAEVNDIETISVNGIAQTITSKNVDITVPTTLASLSDDSTHRLVTDTEKTAWDGKGTYSKPSGGIPATDLDSSVQTSLGKADTALQSETYTGTITSVKMNGTTIASSGEADLGTVITSHQDITGKEDKTNKVTSISSSSTNTEYPSALAVYNLFNSIVNGNEVEY